MFGLAGCASRSALPSPPGSGSTWCAPAYSKRSPRNARRTISIVSRMRASGFANGTPCRPSTTCGPAGAEPEDEAVARDRRHRHRGHRGHARRARADLHDAGAEQEPLRLRGEIGERRDRVLAPRLRRPRRVDAELLGLDRERGERARSRASRPDAGPPTPIAVFTRDLLQRALEEGQVVDAEVELAAEEDRGRAEHAARDRLLGGGAQLLLHRAAPRRARRSPRRRGRRPTSTSANTSALPRSSPSPRTPDTPRRGRRANTPRVLRRDGGAHQRERVDREVRIVLERDAVHRRRAPQREHAVACASAPPAPRSATGCRSP